MMGEVGMKEGDFKQFRENPTAIAEHLTRALATDDCQQSSLPFAMC